MSFPNSIILVTILLVLICSQIHAAGKNYCLWSTGCTPGTTGITAPVESDCAPGLICMQSQTKALFNINTICIEDKNLINLAPPACTLTNDAGAAPCCNIRATKIGVGATAICRLGTAGVCTQRSL